VGARRRVFGSLLVALLALGVTTSSCKTAPQPAPAPSASAAVAGSAEAPSVAEASAPAAASVAPPSDGGESASRDAGGDAGTAAAALPWSADGGAGCRLLRGPIEMPLKAPAALFVRGDMVEAVLDDDGKPKVASFPAPAVVAPASTPVTEPFADGAGKGYGVPCALAGERIFCADHTGAVHRWAIDGTGDHVVGSSRTGSRISAALLPGGHTALGYLASRQTTEGWTSEAWLVADDAAPVRLSEDGSGATSLTLTSRGAGVLALMIDSRAALTAMHARPITLEGASVHLGEDVVVFVGGPGDRRTTGALVTPPSTAAHDPAWGLLPIAKDVGSFGLALVRIDEPPHVDEPVVWSMYANGLDPAPVSGVSTGAQTWAARVIPRDATPGAARVLELGSIAHDGSFSAREEIPTTGKPTDVTLVADAHGALWLAWLDGGGSWLERLACPAAAATALPGHP
jgi:hypothetical protein